MSRQVGRGMDRLVWLVGRRQKEKSHTFDSPKMPVEIHGKAYKQNTMPSASCNRNPPIVHTKKKLIPEVYLTFFKCFETYSSFLFSSVLKLLLSF